MMNQTCTDYLFALYISCEPVPLDTLLEQIGTSGQEDTVSYETPQDILSAMEKYGLIEISQADETQYIDLTQRGREVSVYAADIITEVIVSDWQQRTVQKSA